MQRERQVIVIGAGIGGLATALELAGQGQAVTVCEAADEVGGKLRQVTFEGHEGIDCGPTVFTMRWVFDELFERAGLSLDAALKLARLPLLARHFWPAAAGNTGPAGHPGTKPASLDLFADEARSVDAIAAFASPAEGRRYQAFCAQARRTFETLNTTYMAASRPTMPQLVYRIARNRPADLTAIHPFQTLWRALERQFHDPRLRQLFGRYATYCGASPYQAPATLSLIAHVESCGVWLVEGGMKRLATAMAQAAQDRGAHIRTGAPVEEILIQGTKVIGVRLRSGERLSADAVIYNGDVNALAQGRLGRALADPAFAIPPRARSQSAMTWTMIGDVEGADLAPHTVFFSDDYRAEFDDVFRRGHAPVNPTVYVHAPDRPADAEAPHAGPERLFALINAPANGDTAQNDAEELDRCQRSLLTLLKRCGASLRLHPQHLVRSSPTDFNHRFPATGGALYGRATHGWRSSFQRRGSRTSFEGLYLAGGSVHPGPGVPMAALSGRLAAKSLLSDFRSPVQYRRAATIGGTSTA
ncbi:MAG: 1-hydroxycarotenoid 3,4-desaturase CrtD [Pseudomonadota bacterium]